MAKTNPASPGWFLTIDANVVQKYFQGYLGCYNTEHYHLWTGYVKPMQ